MPSYTASGASPNVIYTVSVSLTRKSATTARCTVTCTTKLRYAESFLGTGHGLTGYLWIPGVGEKSWTIKKSTDAWKGTKDHTTSAAWDINVGPDVTSVSGFQFKARNGYGTAGDLGWQSGFSAALASGVSYAKTSHANLKISSNASSQAQAVATLSDIPQNVGYTRVICWYLGKSLLKTVAVSEGSHSYTFTGLMPNTTYSLTAEVRIGSASGSVLATLGSAVTTKQETGELTVTPKATYLTVEVSGMFNTPNYARTIEFYVKRAISTTYDLIAIVSEQGTSTQANITNLISNADYDVKVLIKNGATTLKTMAAPATTIADTTLFPTAEIERISQKLGTRTCTITWIADKDIAGTTYAIEAKADGESDWTKLDEVNEISSPIEVEAHNGNVSIVFRIASSNEVVAEELVNYSDEFTFYVRDDFVWDIAKAAGQPFSITAKEWNRLREYAVARNEQAGNAVEIPLVRAGDAITAEIYNTMKGKINLVSPINIADKQRGDAICASDIDALRVAINNVE